MYSTVRRRALATVTASALLATTILALPQAAVAEEALGSIEGTVRSDDIGWGAGLVTAYQVEADVILETHEAVIEQDGSYALGSLPAGSYRLAFSDNGFSENGETYWREWWDDAAGFDAARDIRVGPGQVVTEVDVDLETVQGVASYPTLRGTPLVGSTITATPGAWPTGTVLLYDWYAGERLLGTTRTASFAITPSLIGKRISVVVYGEIDALGRPSASEWQFKPSYETAAVRGRLTAGTPRVSGVAIVGRTLTAKPGTWTKGTTFGYQWYAGGKAIKGATKSTYKASAKVSGSSLSVKVTGKKSGYESASKTSKATSKVALVGTPSIVGAAKVTAKVTAKPGTWTRGTAFSYQWYANGKAIKKATKSTYTIPASVKGKSLTVKVTGKKAGHTTSTKTSKATAKVKAAAKPAPKPPSAVASPVSKTSCPKSHPIKGNQGATDWIYHVPGSTYYSRTHPEQCFATIAAAQRAGYRAPLR